MTETLQQQPELALPLDVVELPPLDVINPLPTAQVDLRATERAGFGDGWEYSHENTERVAEAIETVPFLPSPEVVRGIESFYGEHRQLGRTIDTMLGHEPAIDAANRAEETELLQSTLDASPLKDRIADMFNRTESQYRSDHMNSHIAIPALAAMRLERMKNPEDTALKEAELRLLKSAAEVQYAEPSLGITTIGEAELQEVTNRQAVIKQRFVESGLFVQSTQVPDSNQFISPNTRFGNNVTNFLEDPTVLITNAQQKFWDDTRFAGQLLFHGSTNFDDMYRTGMIATRRVQEHLYGSYNTKNRTQDGEQLHAPVIHWSEMYDENGYRFEQGRENSGTVAVPLGEIIKYAPYARDAEYATLQLKPDVADEVIPKVTIQDGVGRIGTGMDDVQGKHGVDRSFYRYAHDANPTDTLDQAPDGYAIPLDEKTIRIALGEEADKTYQYGLGEHFPSHLEIDVPNPYDYAAPLTDTEKAERQAVIHRSIVDLQHQSISNYGGQVVVPIRSGVMEFYVSDGGALAYRPLATFSRRPSQFV